MSERADWLILMTPVTPDDSDMVIARTEVATREARWLEVEYHANIESDDDATDCQWLVPGTFLAGAPKEQKPDQKRGEG